MKTSKKAPLVSVIVTTYNRKEFLKETIDSILNQTFRNFELIIVDNYSKYDFFKFLSSFNDERIRAFHNRNNGIIAVNRNHGIKHAIGGYISFCDDDDIWMPNKLSEQLKNFDDDKLIGVGSTSIFIDDLTLHRQKKFKKNFDLGFHQLLTKQTAALSSLIIKNEGFMFDTNESMKTVEDFEFQLKLTSKTGKKIRILAVPLICYRIHPQSEGKDISAAENVFNVLSKYKNFLSNDSMKALYYKHYFNLGIMALRSDNELAKHYFASAFRYASKEQKYFSFLAEKLSGLPKFLIKKMLIIYYKTLNYLAV